MLLVLELWTSVDTAPDWTIVRMSVAPRRHKGVYQLEVVKYLRDMGAVLSVRLWVTGKMSVLRGILAETISLGVGGELMLVVVVVECWGRLVTSPPTPLVQVDMVMVGLLQMVM